MPTFPPPSKQCIPPRTVLDGELVWVGSGPFRQGFFIAFDALCVKGVRVGFQPLLQRLQHMVQVCGLTEAEECAALQAAAQSNSHHSTNPPVSTSQSASSSSSSSRPLAPLCHLKKQQAAPPGNDSIFVLYKRHWPVSAAQLDSLESAAPACPYPTGRCVQATCVSGYPVPCSIPVSL
jgi:hypothetical protein